MKREDLRIVFMGTPEFAVPSLNILVEAGYQLAAVVTPPDRKSGRGRKLMPSPVKQYALDHSLKVLQPEKLREQSFLNELKALQPDLIVVVAFRMLPEVVWSLPTLGTFNLHASLLPQYRGAAPINHALINGEMESGLTTFFIDDKIDTGEVIDQRALKIGENETFGQLHDRMIQEGARLVLETCEMILKDKVKSISQNKLLEKDSLLKKAPKITREFCRISWTKNLREIHNFVRGLSPYPAAYTYLIQHEKHPEYFKILRSEKEEITHSHKPGKVISDNKSILKVAVDDGYLQILLLQQTGKRAMNVVDFLNGFQFDNTAKFE